MKCTSNQGIEKNNIVNVDLNELNLDDVVIHIFLHYFVLLLEKHEDLENFLEKIEDIDGHEIMLLNFGSSLVKIVICLERLQKNFITNITKNPY